MENLKKILVLVVTIIVITGCSMKSEYNMEIKSDKSMDFAVILAFDDEFIEGMLSMNEEEGQVKEYTEEEKWAYIENSINDSEGESPESYGFKKEKYDKDGYKGYKYIKNISSIDDISGDVSNFDINDFINIEKSTVFTKDGEKYKANFVLLNENAASAEGMDVMFDIKFVVTLPNKSISNNATEVSNEGKTLTWNLLEEESKTVEFEFEVKPNNNLIIYIVIGGIVIAVIVVVVIIIASKKNKKKKNNIMNNLSTRGAVNSQTQMQTNIESMNQILQSDSSVGVANQSIQNNPTIQLMNQALQNGSTIDNQINSNNNSN